ncbi:hypothetical protein JCM25156A_26410 [Komagataeibacter kakiaceti JCM 25156]
MSAYLKRPLKVLDVGCAQGFFSLNLAKHGATVTGIDFQEENINLCKELARTSGLDVNFVRTDAKEFLEQEKLGYDLILGFSIFHHVINRDGIDVVRKILEKLARDGASLLLEMALKTEPLAWARAQPADQRQFLSGIGFVHEMKTHATHLSKISRPTFFCSDKFVLLNEFFDAFDWMKSGNGIRTFSCGNNIVQISHSSAKIGYQKLEMEIRALQKMDASNEKDKCGITDFNIDGDERWIVRDKINGESLNDLIRQGKSYDPYKVVMDILDLLEGFESQGLYHNDVRIWNVIIDGKGKAKLIDFSSLTQDSKDCVWPHDLFLSFMIFIVEVHKRSVPAGVACRNVTISPFDLPEPFRSAFSMIWKMPRNDWTFRLLKLLCGYAKDNKASSGQMYGDDLWKQAVESLLTFHTHEDARISRKK